VGQAVWLQINSHYRLQFTHAASRRKHAGVSEGWTYQLKDQEGEIYEYGEWVSERLLRAA